MFITSDNGSAHFVFFSVFSVLVATGCLGFAGGQTSQLDILYDFSNWVPPMCLLSNRAWITSRLRDRAGFYRPINFELDGRGDLFVCMAIAELAAGLGRIFQGLARPVCSRWAGGVEGAWYWVGRSG